MTEAEKKVAQLVELELIQLVAQGVIKDYEIESVETVKE
jgi:hypothetical protein